MQLTLHARPSTQTGPGTSCAAKFLDQQTEVAGLTIRTYRSDGNPACLQIFRSLKRIYRKIDANAETFSIGQPAQPEYRIPAIPNGTDITSSGHPELIITTWSGGAHCCFTWFLYELEPKIRILATLNIGNSDLTYIFKDPADAQYYFQTYDETFTYWHTSFASSPAVKITLRWVTRTADAGAFQIAFDKMKQPPPASAEWQRDFLEQAHDAFKPGEAFEDKPDELYFAGSGFWKPMLILIYTGRSSLAWKVVEETWPSGKPGKDQFLNDFCTQLTASEYWPALKPTIQDPPPVCTAIFARGNSSK